MIKFSPLVPREINSCGKGQQHWSLLVRREGRKAPTKACWRVTINSNLPICPLLSYCRDVEALANLTEALVLIDSYTASLFIYIYIYIYMYACICIPHKAPNKQLRLLGKSYLGTGAGLWKARPSWCLPCRCSWPVS